MYEIIRAVEATTKDKADQRYFKYASCFQILFDTDYDMDGFHKVVDDIFSVDQSEELCATGNTVKQGCPGPRTFYGFFYFLLLFGAFLVPSNEIHYSNGPLLGDNFLRLKFFNTDF